MKRLLSTIMTFLAVLSASSAALTLQECLEKARENYPAIRMYDLISLTESVRLSDIDKSWLPRVGLNGQVTVQNAVPALPDELSNMMSQMGGQSVKGLGKTQYSVGVEVGQTVWDGGASSGRRRVARAEAAGQSASVDVEMYAVRERVESIFFGVLLLEQQVEMADVTATLLEANLAKVNAMVQGGTAMQADADMIEAQLLTTRQQIAEATAACQGYRRALGVFIGEEVGERPLELPSDEMPADMRNSRPEMCLFETRRQVNAARRELADASLMPTVGFFARGNYGYPGYNYFESMMSRDPKFSLMAGLKVGWNIDSFYTRRNTRRKQLLSDAEVVADSLTFAHNTNVKVESQQGAIKGMRAVMADDSRIVELCGNVRRAAEARLEAGVIDATALLTKISDEHRARLNACYHRVQLVQYIYQLKNTLNQ